MNLDISINAFQQAQSVPDRILRISAGSQDPLQVISLILIQLVVYSVLIMFSISAVSWEMPACISNLSGAYLDRCYSTGTVSGGYASDYAGGLAGYAAQARITNCYASGNIEADSDVGGLIGMADSSYTAKSYSCGSVSGVIFVGGLVGWNYYSTIEECFWDLETSGQSWSDGGIGRTTLEMKTKAMFTNSQWDFFVMWGIDEGQTYPFLKPAS